MNTKIFFSIMTALLLSATQAFAQDSYKTSDSTAVEESIYADELESSDIYDYDRDAEIDSLRRIVDSLQSSVEETNKESQRKSIWDDRAKYFNIAYVNQSITQKDIDGTWKNDYGVALMMGKTFYLHKKPLLNMIKFGIDWSYFDINFAKYTDNFGYFDSSLREDGDNGHYYNPDMQGGYDSYYLDPLDMYQAEIGMSVGASVTINPIDHLKANGYFRVTPSFSALYVDEDISTSYGTFFSAGGAVSYKVISIGIEGRWGNTKYDSLVNFSDIDGDYDDDIDLEGNQDGKSKWKTGSVRFYLSFRF